MTFTAKMRQDLWQIENYLFGGGYPNPMSNAEQLSFLFFFYLMEGIDGENAQRAKLLKQPYQSLYTGDWTLRNPLNAPKKGQETIPRDQLRWSVWARGLSGESLVRFVQDEVFAFYEEVAAQSAANFMRGARLGITDPTVLTQVVTLVDGLKLDQEDADTKGDLFEDLLRRIKQAGALGQFRTPRHIIRAIVEMIDPKIGETVYDPAAGTAGFLVAAYNHIRLANSSPSGITDVEIDGKTQRRGIGDRLSQQQASMLQSGTFFGNDVDPQMVRLATMNLTLRGLPNVRILLRNVLTTTLDDEQREALRLPDGGYGVILANPPFAGKIDNDRVVDDVKVGNSKATEVLFLKYMMESLRDGGRCGLIVPEGLLFGSTGAHKEIRRQLVENNRVDAVMSLPGGVFQPYSGVKTSVLLFRKGGSTERVLFLHVDGDGYKLDANHDTPVEADDLPAMMAAFRESEAKGAAWASRDLKAPWLEKWWFADSAELRANEFNLSAGRYRPVNASTAVHRNPRELLDELAELEREIHGEVTALREALAE